MKTIRTVSMVVSLGLLALAGAACSQFDSAKMEKSITEEFEKQTQVKLKSVSCPKDVTEKAGATFTCTGSGDNGLAATFEVLMQGGGKLTWTLKSTTGGAPTHVASASEEGHEKHP